MRRAYVSTLRLTSDFSGYWDLPRGVPQYVTCPVYAPGFPQRYYKLARQPLVLD